MRFAIGLLATTITLAGCTASPLDAMNRMGTTAEAEPFPANYKDLLRHRYGLYRPPDLEVSYPRAVLGDTAFESARWYVCVRTIDGANTIHVISDGKLDGTIPIPEAPEDEVAQPNLCDGGTYEALG